MAIFLTMASVIEELPTDCFLRFKSDQLYNVRKLLNLENPNRIKEAIQLLRDWLQKQDYFYKKDFSDGYFERLLVLSKGSVERAKSCFDKICTYRTILPHYFNAIDINTFGNDFKTFNSLILPDVTDEYARVNLFKINSNVPLQPDLFFKYISYSIIMCEYAKMIDYPNGFVLMIDIQDVNIVDLLAVLSVTQLHHMVTLYMGGYGMRIQGIHLITKSKVSDALVSLAKQVLSKKVGGRLHVHRNMETIYEYIPKKILPAEYGGDAVPLNVMLENFLKELGTKKYIEYMKETQSATVDMKKKPKDSSTDELIMAGSFRTLTVD